MKCTCCEKGAAATRAMEQEMVAKVGWYGHYVFDDPSYPFDVNIHTHGIDKKYKHPDLQTCLPLPQEIAHGILWSVVDQIKAGKKFQAGDKAFDIINNYPVTFIDAIELERKVLRIILPDPAGTLDKDEMDEPYFKQWEITPGN